MRYGGRVWIIILVLAFVAACGSAVNQANFDRIENDMSREAVIDILGEPTESNDIGIAGFSGGMATWRGEDGTTITIQFVNGKVKGKQFSSGSSE